MDQFVTSALRPHLSNSPAMSCHSRAHLRHLKICTRSSSWPRPDANIIMCFCLLIYYCQHYSRSAEGHQPFVVVIIELLTCLFCCADGPSVVVFHSVGIGCSGGGSGGGGGRTDNVAFVDDKLIGRWFNYATRNWGHFHFFRAVYIHLWFTSWVDNANYTTAIQPLDRPYPFINFI